MAAAAAVRRAAITDVVITDAAINQKGPPDTETKTQCVVQPSLMWSSPMVSSPTSDAVFTDVAVVAAGPGCGTSSCSHH
jgi:hypothetical protein